jgi:hypothetical protein
MEAVMNRRNCIIMLAIGCLLVLLASGAVFAADKIKAGGILTSVEDDGTVIVKDMKGQSNGYLLSPSVIVQDYQGRYISLRDIPLPYNVYFEYEYAPKGFMITLIKEVAG